MPRFAANLAFLFTERPLIERFAAAAAAGFPAVELQFPYDHAPSAIRAEIERHDLTQLGLNTALGGRDGDSGLAAVPGRERDWDAAFKQALDYAVAIGGPAIHCMAGKDRTGILAALLLATLGVPDTTIAADYALTERRLPALLAWATEHDPELAAWLAEAAPTGMLDTPADAMLEFLSKLRSEHGTVDDYIAGAGVNAQTTEMIRARYLL